MLVLNTTCKIKKIKPNRILCAQWLRQQLVQSATHTQARQVTQRRMQAVAAVEMCRMQIMEEDIRFDIVTFVDENNAPGIVASNWIKEDRHTCFYPNVRTEEMKEKLLWKMAASGDSGNYIK